MNDVRPYHFCTLAKLVRPSSFHLCMCSRGSSDSHCYPETALQLHPFDSHLVLRARAQQRRTSLPTSRSYNHCILASVRRNLARKFTQPFVIFISAFAILFDWKWILKLVSNKA